MTFDDLVKLLKEQWPALLASAILLTPIIWTILYFLYGHRLETLNKENASLESEVGKLRQQIEKRESPPAHRDGTTDGGGGIVGAYESLTLNSVVNRAIAASKLTVTIAGYWLPQWVENGAIHSALASGASVTVVVAKGDSSFLEERGIELGADPGYSTTRAQDGLKRLMLVKTQLRGAETKNLRLFEHDRRLSLLFIQADNRFFFGTYLHGKSVSDMFMIETSGTDFVGQSIRKEFDSLLASAPAVSLESAGA